MVQAFSPYLASGIQEFIRHRRLGLHVACIMVMVVVRVEGVAEVVELAEVTVDVVQTVNTSVS